MLLSSVTPGQSAPPSSPIDSVVVSETVESLGAVVKREYFDPDVADKVDAMLRRSLIERRYATVTTATSLAAILSRDLYAVTHDKHLAVAVVHDAPSTQEAAASQADEARAIGVRHSNAGVRRVEILPGNVGYLDLSTFYRPEEARDAISAAMRLLAQADAVILDMRMNSGGSPATMALIVSYLFDEPNLPLFDIVHRAPEPTDHYATESALPVARDGRRPAYVLTAERTFSAGEGLAFLLQERHRAEIVGETTAGAANPGRPYPVNKRFSVTVPNGRIESAVSGRNWEGAGVTPDVQVSAGSALPTAYAGALRRLIERQSTGQWRDTLEQLFRSINTQLSNR